jgi:biotin carboxyl carrier protein
LSDADRRTDRPTAGRAGADRRSDHAAIARLADDLLPALIAKLSSTQLGELEVREGEWHVRLRRPYGVGPGEGRRATDKPSRSQPGHEGHGHARAGVEGHRGSRPASGSGASAGSPSGITAGSGAASASNNGTSARSSGRDADGERSRSIATSPAVGIFHPGPKAASGTRVRSGDALGSVDVLGVRQDVTAPADGIVGQTLVEAGMAVEYGQDLIRLELTAPAAPAAGGAPSEAR